jgi:hypothetical protein
LKLVPVSATFKLASRLVLLATFIFVLFVLWSMMIGKR